LAGELAWATAVFRGMDVVDGREVAGVVYPIVFNPE
jgi:hypothetical protein